MKNKTKRIIKITVFSLLSVIFLTFIIALCVLHGRISTMISLKKKGDHLYTVNYQQNYHLDKALKAEIKTEEDLFKFICDEMYFGYDVDTNIMQYACSAFTTQTPDGKKVVGRNFDLNETDTLCVYTNPKGGYKSISTVSMDMVAVGGNNKTSPKSFIGRAALLCAPYICVDGMNEKGLSASLLDMEYGETHQRTDNPELIITMAVRLLIDRAATVDEAISLLGQYDIHTAHGWTQHIFIADRNGDCAIVEWYHDEMKIEKYNVCTNFMMSAWWLHGNYTNQCERFDFLDNSLKTKSENTIEESMKLLEGVKQDHTNWSVIYNLDDFTADYCTSKNYDEIYHIKKSSFSNSGLIMTLIYLGIILLIDAILFIILMIKKKKDKIVEE